MDTLGYALFSTALGTCGIAWSAHGLTGVQLPEMDEAATRRRMVQRFAQSCPAAPPPQVQAAIAAITALLAGQPGEPRDLTHLVLDMEEVPAFHQRVYALARQIPPGQTRTYGELAQALGVAGAARAVGQALGANPFAPVVPCHRVLAAHGGAGGFSAHGGTRTKLRLLEIEGARFGGGPGLFD
jgi:methylated-DNA-[protein]-cysteine S-methyltransferase